MHHTFSVEKTKLELHKLGFQNISYQEDDIVIHDFQLYAQKDLSLNTSNYYSYPKGIITDYHKIQIKKNALGAIQIITVPIECLPNAQFIIEKADWETNYISWLPKTLRLQGDKSLQ